MCMKENHFKNTIAVEPVIINLSDENDKDVDISEELIDNNKFRPFRNNN